MENKLDPRLF